jgi:hypothetical protein
MTKAVDAVRIEIEKKSEPTLLMRQAFFDSQTQVLRSAPDDGQRGRVNDGHRQRAA